MGPDERNLPLGSRVVVRWRLPEPDPATGATLTDAVGTLVEDSPEALTVETSGGPVSIARDRVTAAKVVPPKPSRRGAAHLAISIEDLQRVAAVSWGALECGNIGDWELRASAGLTQRANSVVPVGDPGVPLSEAVAEVEQWYAARGLPARFALAGPVGFAVADDPLGALLLDRGYTIASPALNLTAASASVAGADPGGPPVHVGEGLEPAWLQAYLTSRPADPEVAAAVLGGSPRQLFAHISPGGGLSQQLGERPADAAGTTPVAIGRLAIAHGWAGLGAVWTHPAYRGRGLAGHLTAALAARAREEGVHVLHLQVEPDNAGALHVYRRMGLVTHSAYAYLTAPAETR